ncbi:phosphoribosylamine--glycine ligase [Alkalibacterium sp. 20]|uniref:phosphoribosylamine--glycine ligase n=1 Tax=Alkalibacterium sp. 20 TaxID=1798803 RepID=UPI00090009E6|nr:phosphoribosylamine--glycine ligase [Alkalibacterium sp. 20]OJF93526.1 phosphoribosylamine--glycine ligase [Alkalibacterium sp. 20]
MKLLVVGAGGREHAIAKKLLSSEQVETVFCAPGNAGMKKDGIEVLEIDQSDHTALINFAKKEDISWTVVGPEIPLINGIVDDFQAEGLKIFGPSKAATLIEASKEFAKELMVKKDIPTADYQSFGDYDSARKYIEQGTVPVVIKADGLAAGKGVVVAETKEEALNALKDMMLDKKYGALNTRVVIEEYLTGEEFSLMAFVNGEKVYPMVISQDHKRLLEEDKGPNTGGMGAYAPVLHISESIVKEAVERILVPAAVGMMENGTPFVGILYAGVMATDAGPKNIEFNARFGDPETQVLMNRLESDLAQVITDLLEDNEPELIWKKDGVSLGVVVAAEGYPENYQKSIPLSLPESTEGVHLYFAGVKEEAGELVSDGGRIYLVEASGDTIKDAQDNIYQALASVDTSGCVYRTDIGNRAL